MDPQHCLQGRGDDFTYRKGSSASSCSCSSGCPHDQHRLKRREERREFVADPQQRPTLGPSWRGEPSYGGWGDRHSGRAGGGRPHTGGGGTATRAELGGGRPQMGGGGDRNSGRPCGGRPLTGGWGKGEAVGEGVGGAGSSLENSDRTRKEG